VLIDKAAIRRLIPHAGAMCLLDTVIAWDETSITCETATGVIQSDAGPIIPHYLLLPSKETPYARYWP